MTAHIPQDRAKATPLGPSSWSRYRLLAALYLAQGLPYGFFTQTLPALLRDTGASLPAVSASSLLTLPWAFKFLIAPLADRYSWPRMGLRRSWIIPLQGAAIVVLGVLATLHPRETLLPIFIGFLLLNLCAAAQDVSTDGWAVDLLEPHQRGIGGGLQVAGYRMGMVLGGWLILIAYSRWGWSTTMVLLATVMALTTVPVLFADDPEQRARRAQREPRARFRDCFGFLKQPGASHWLLLLLLYKTAHAFSTGMLRPLLIDQGLSLETIAQLLGGVGFTGGLIGALFGGWWISRRIDRRRTLLIFSFTQLLTVSLYITLTFPAPSAWVVGVCFLEHLTSGMATAALFASMMDTCRPLHSASDYTFQACAVVIATGLASAVSGLSAEAAGYRLHFGLATFVGLVFWLIIVALLRRPEIHHLLHAHQRGGRRGPTTEAS